MSDLLVIVPTRGRPGNAERLARAVTETSGLATSVCFAVDQDDDLLPEYRDRLHGYEVALYPHLSMVAKLNRCARERMADYKYLGFMGDDHLPRTDGWDEAVMDALGEAPGIVYCDDRFQGPALPTAVFMHAMIVERLGWMALPTVEHLYCDNAWLDLGNALGACTYLPDVVIEHLHPHAGKAEADGQYERVNSPSRHHDDRDAWEHWRHHDLQVDVARIRSAVAGIGGNR